MRRDGRRDRVPSDVFLYFRSHSIMDRTIASGAVDSGSIPLGSIMNMFIICAAVIAAAVFVIAALRSEWERRQLKIEHYYVYKDADGTQAESCTAAVSERRAVRLVFVSDVHNYFDDVHRTDAVIQAVESEAPDLVLLGGDVVTVSKKKSRLPDTVPAESFAAKLAGRLPGLPVIYAPGNHELRFKERYPDEYAGYTERLRSAGITMLEDDRIAYGDLAVYGVCLDDKFFGKHIPVIGVDPDMPDKYLIGRIGLPDKRDFNILLMHSPLYLDAAAAWGADLVLSGHFHGGTIRLPDGRGLMTPQYHFFNKLCSGIHHAGRTAMIVNRGLGTHSFNIRLNDLPELSVIDIALH